MKRLLSCIIPILFLPMGIGLHAHDFEIGGIYYTITDKTVAVSFSGNSYNSILNEYSGAIEIPEIVTCNGIAYNVSSIMEGAFYNCTGLITISIPASITSIGDCAFYGCTGLTSIIIPEGVYTIGKFAFSGCSNLSSLQIPTSLRKVDINAFENCNSLHTIKGLTSMIEMAGSGLEKFEMNFDDFCKDYILIHIKKWQQKGEFETTSQYQARMTKENQDNMINKLSKQAVTEYINTHQPRISSYNADRETFVLKGEFTDYEVNVPINEAPTFKQNFFIAKFEVMVSDTDDNYTTHDLSITLNDKKYHAINIKSSHSYDYNYSQLDIEIPDIELNLSQNNGQQLATTTPKPTPTIDRSVDQNIPAIEGTNNKTFAVIIGNERYTQVAQVPYAQNDAKVFAEYCKRTLGLPVTNVRQYSNATFGTMLSAMNDIKGIAEAYNGDCNIIFYYAGHGVPNETSRDAYLLPADADGRQTEACYPVSRLYRELGEMGAKNVIVFMDACFSGAQRGEGMLASARGVALKVKTDAPQGNMVVFSAATGDETAFPYQEKGHGMFTYFLLKKLQDTKGDVTLGELAEYIQTNVRQQSIVVNRKSQTPTITPSLQLGDSWKSLKLK